MHAERTVHMGAEIYLNPVLSAGGYDKDAGLLQSYVKRYGMPTLMANSVARQAGGSRSEKALHGMKWVNLLLRLQRIVPPWSLWIYRMVSALPE